MDFESLLRRYMRHVIDREGTSFTYALQASFTEQEEAYLTALGEELEAEANPPRPADAPRLPPPTPEEMQKTIAKMAASATEAFQKPNAFMAAFGQAQRQQAEAMQPIIDAEQQEWLAKVSRIGSPLLR